MPSTQAKTEVHEGDQMSVKDTITKKLTEAFQPIEIDVRDESHLHAGHSGWREGGETHFRVRIISTAFAGQSRLARHRAVNDLLAQELQNSVHALAIEAKTPDEPSRR